ncbi:MAG: TonB-dependent receptor family protein [Bacteroidota bacterium]
MLFLLLFTGLLPPSADTLVLRKELPEIEVVTDQNNNRVKGLEKLIPAGAALQKIALSGQSVNLNTNQARQLLAKVPGVQVWEQDGNQIAIGYRGLSPNRSWEINMRQNMAPIAADPYGYPEAYFAPPMEAVSEIEILRGGAGLLYGPQAGGVFNYALRNNFEKAISGTASMQGGSFGQASGFLQLSANKGKWNINGFVSHRQMDGARPQAAYKNQHAYLSVSRRTEKILFLAECSSFHLLARQPGGLSDSAFRMNPYQSTRNRNHLGVFAILPRIQVNIKTGNQGSLEFQASGYLGERNSVGFVAPVTRMDLAGADGTLSARQVDRDFYNHQTLDARYHLLGTNRKLEFTAGVTFFRGLLLRKQLGNGSKAADYDLAISSAFGRDLDLFTQSLAAYFLLDYNMGKYTKMSVGMRHEQILSAAAGRIQKTASGEFNLPTDRQTNNGVSLPYLGLTHQKNRWQFHAGISRFFRPVLYAERFPLNPTDSVDQNLKNAMGFQFEQGMIYRISKGFLLHLTAFAMDYHNRAGNIFINGAGGTPILLKTNIGASLALGLEWMLDYTLVLDNQSSLSAFVSGTLLRARYENFTYSKNTNGTIEKENLRGKKVENAPSLIVRSGMDFQYKKYSVGMRFSYTSGTYADALNTLSASANAQNGWISPYAVWDAFAGYQFSKRIQADAGVSNLLNRAYFTRRSSGYPGPGIIPADPRNFFVRLKLRI